MATKKDRYCELVKDVRDCSNCMNSHTGRGVKLVQDPNRTEVNLWSHWQGSLDAKIMVIGQDWGEKPDPESYHYWTSDPIYPSLTGKHKQIPKHKFKTDNNLADVICKALKLDLEKKQGNLFLTNAVLCYRDKGFTGTVNPNWFTNCQPFCVRLIDIIQPEAIVTLGYMPLKAMLYGGSLSYDPNFSDPGKKLKISMSMREIVETEDQLYYRSEGSKLTYKVFPVFHCGSWGIKARPLKMQIQDWEKVNVNSHRG
ncbi:MAG TPA: uracil-DNA glycosylase family protein [Candidatus Cloacimonas sp.]|nr:uracil-DNA glycosylase family protein [Candidatus Cloacimonas sp.]